MMDDKRRPDFLLPGGMKCGSTTLDHLLGQHPGISMADDKDTGFLDRKDASTHLNYALAKTDEWSQFSLEDEKQWEQYLSMFPDDDTTKGEASVSYMYSKKAPKHASRHLNEPKAVFILRDPVERAYSHYWHQLRQTRTVYSFKTSLKQDRSILEYSIYPDKIQRWADELGQDNIHILLLEELIEEPQGTMNSVFEFLDVDSTDIDLPTKNPGSYPRLPRVYQLFNLVLYALGKDTTTANLRDDEYWTLPEKAFRKLILTEKKAVMDKKLRSRLETILYHENRDITEWKPEVERYWKGFKPP